MNPHWGERKDDPFDRVDCNTSLSPTFLYEAFKEVINFDKEDNHFRLLSAKLASDIYTDI